jgi:hypothetical protein
MRSRFAYRKVTFVTEIDNQQRQLAIMIAKEINPTEADALREWAYRLLDIRNERVSAAQKAKRAVILTASSKVILPAVKIIARQTKKHGWDNRTSTQKLGMGAAAVGVALFGSANAGIAALGTAVGVPLWVVLGGGAMFMKHLIEALLEKQQSGASYTVLDANKKDGQ